MGVLPKFNYKCLVLGGKSVLFYGKSEPVNIIKNYFKVNLNLLV